jgi:glutamate--cysteine ligase
MSGPLTEDAAEAYIGERGFTVGRPRRIGVELEWLVHYADDPAAGLTPEASAAAVGPLEAAGPLPGGGRVTREPGGQVELSSRPAEGLAALIDDVDADLATVAAALGAHGLVLSGGGLDARRAPRRVLDDRRYRAMEAYFDDDGAGGAMMCTTASVQVNLEIGDADGDFDFRRRWRLAHRLGPVLTAAFADSPVLDGRPTGWKSTRQALWARLDPGRTLPVGGAADPRRAWASYALDAHVMCIRRDAPSGWTAPPDLTFRSWLRGNCAERRPTLDDLDYHLGTLFPPVRPRGRLELRMIDAQRGDGWIVPAALCAMLFDDPEASAAAWDATEPITEDDDRPAWRTWLGAARDGLDDPDLRKAATACFAAANAALDRSGAPERARTAVAEFTDRYVDRGRCPADDRHDARPPGRRAPTRQEVPS